MSDPFGIQKGYGVLRTYRQALSPAARTLKTSTGKLKPVLPARAKKEPKHKKPLQLGF